MKKRLCLHLLLNKGVKMDHRHLLDKNTPPKVLTTGEVLPNVFISDTIKQYNAVCPVVFSVLPSVRSLLCPHVVVHVLLLML